MNREIRRLVEEAEAYGRDALREGLEAAKLDALDLPTLLFRNAAIYRGAVVPTATNFERGSSCMSVHERPMAINDLVRLPPT